MDVPESLPGLSPQISDALDRGAVVVTANQRAARTLRQALDRRNRQQGLTSWQPATVLPWEAWTAGLWRTLLLNGDATELLLSRSQEHTLWRSILTSDTELPGSLRSPDSLAELAADAWKLLARYDGRQRLAGAWNSSETRAFQRWVTEFERRCRAQRLLSGALLESTLQKAMEQQRLRLKEPIVLVGFDDWTPAQQNLIKAIQQSGSQVEESLSLSFMEHRMLLSTEDETHEILSAARWAKKLLKENSQTRIAVIVPTLDGRRNAIDRTFREILAPELEDIQALNREAPYEFSLGTPLSEMPMVQVALDLLRWFLSPLPLERVSALLVSPLFAMQESEYNARAVFDAFELRRAKLLLPEISLPRLIEVIRVSKRRPQLTHLFHTLQAMARTGSVTSLETRSHAAWADLIRELLQVSGWGRRTGEDSIEFQTRRKWESTLDELTALDFDGVHITFTQAVRELVRLTQQTLFAPESHNAPVQIMGPLEAAGIHFDAIWFLGAGDLSWPMRSAANPLLPWPLQRDLGIPGADSTVEDLRSQRITERVATSAPVVIFSYAAETKNGIQRPSPLLQDLHLESASIEEIARNEPAFDTIALEEFSDLAPLPPVPDHVIPGGAEILKLQAACGFRAFAERRLGSVELREIELGMDAAERGSIVHHTLEHFWKQIGSQSKLKTMTSEERSAALSQSIEYGLRRTTGATAWERAYVDLQRARLFALLIPWLDLELQREPFTVKFSEEESADVPIGPLRLNLRVDRIDVTEEGEIILDYKTGGAKSSQWQGERPDEPQLPLYAVVAMATHPETPLVDLAFAQIRAGKEMALESFTRKITTGKKTSKRISIPLEDQLLEWRRILEELANDFHRGATQVDPKNYPTTCARCAQRILCRLNPAAFDEDFDEETAIDAANG